jgi:hypothetical protein
VVCYGKCTKKHMNRVGNRHLHYNIDLMLKNHSCLQVVDAFQVGKRGGDGSFKRIIGDVQKKEFCQVSNLHWQLP